MAARSLETPTDGDGVSSCDVILTAITAITSTTATGVTAIELDTIIFDLATSVVSPHTHHLCNITFASQKIP
jgi:hypothetical protein